MLKSKVFGLVMVLALLPNLGLAQPVTIQNDNVQQDSEAVVSCGFCASEKFGAMFYAPALNANQFPFDLTKVFIALAGVEVTFDLAARSFTCAGVMSSGTMPTQISVNYELYAGVTPPQTISGLPAMGAWPGETVLMPSTSAMITLSTPQMNGQWQLNFQEIQLNGVTVAPPNTYIRAVVTIPMGTNQHDACSSPVINLSPPGGVAFRDTDITGSSRRNFIHAAATIGGAGGWIFNEDFQASLSGSNINGDWLIRLEVEPHNSTRPPAPDASVIHPDAEAPDAGFEMDAAEPPAVDAQIPDTGSGLDAALPDDVGNPPIGDLDAMVRADSGTGNSQSDAASNNNQQSGNMTTSRTSDSCGCSATDSQNDRATGFAIFVLMALMVSVRRRRIL